MVEIATPPPARRPELVIRPLGDQGRYVVKDPHTGAYFTIGEQEHFLLAQLDGKRDTDAIRKAFEERFGEPLSADDLEGFLNLARARGLLVPLDAAQLTASGTQSDPAIVSPSPTGPPPRPAPRRQSFLFWRKSLFDPDRLFTWLAPRLRFLWTRAFLFISAGGILAAAIVAWAGRDRLVASLAHAWRWETAMVVWLTLVATIFCHEFAHGLTCKHHGGEVREVGFLLLFFLPCFYCNVSDAWLFKEKSKRLWVTLAGGYCDLCLWALAVFSWRLSDPYSAFNYVSWVVLSVLGARVFFNFNPLLKLDGYYLLSDWLEVPNLRQRAWGRLAGWSRWLLWGAPRPKVEPRSRFLLVYGLASWLFSLAFLALMLAGFSQILGSWWGLPGVGVVVLLGVATVPGLFHGFANGEVRNMILFRRKRTFVWLLLFAGLGAFIALGRMDARATGSFEVRPTVRVELRAPVTGFLRDVFHDEGEKVYEGKAVALLEVPDLDAQMEQKRAAVREGEAQLALARAGPRPEEVAEQRSRVARLRTWRDLAEQDLTRSRQALQHELTRLEKEAAEHQAEKEHAREVVVRLERFLDKQAVSQEELRETKKRVQMCCARQEQAEAKRRVRQALGTQEPEAELARREKELADSRAALRLLEAAGRPEEIAAREAHLARLREEARYLEVVRGKLRVFSPVAGVVSTPRLKEKIGQYLREGDLICVIEASDSLEVEVTLDESDVERVRPGQVVELKCRAFPLQTLAARVDRVASRAVRPEPPSTAPSSARGELSSTMVVYCRLDDADPGLRPGMTGQARVNFWRGSVGQVLADRVLRFVRSEFWW